MVRLQKYLAECGVASRRQAEELIRAGRITVNGAAAELGQRITPGVDAVAVDGKPVASEEKLYVLLNKPPGVVTTAQDTHGRKTVLHCTRGVRGRVFPVGRLDMDVTGVLLLTNDGDLANRLMHPRYGVTKVYTAWVAGEVGPDALAALRKGVDIGEGEHAAPAKADIVDRRPGKTLLRLELREGRKREVKRMCAAVGHPVQRLRRVAFANLSANMLRVGEWRYLSDAEVDALRRLAGMQTPRPASSDSA